MIASTREPNEYWYKCDLDRNTLKALSMRTNREASIQFGSYFFILISLGMALVLTWGSVWAWGVFMVYSALWSFGNASGHEACHGTPFRNQKLNQLLLYISAWMENWEPITVKWVHARHHSYTSMVEDDAEYLLPNPIRWKHLLGLLTGWNQVWHYNKELVQLSFGRANYLINKSVPESEIPNVFRNARFYLASYLVIIAASFVSASWLPVCLLIFPRIAGAPVHGVLRILQHGALATEQKDHRLSTRSMRVNPVLGYFYCNMNYHIEHHMYPMVPFHALPALHEKIRDRLPRPSQGVFAAMQEVISTKNRQAIEPRFVYPQVFGGS